MRPTDNFLRFNDSQRHALDSRRNLVVRANAGSGKTSVLVERIVQLVARNWEAVQEGEEPLATTAIVAITFTRKAAAQLQEGLRTAFGQMAKQAPTLAEQAFWKTRAEELARAAIGTIDSLCASILREFGLDEHMAETIEPNFTMLTDYEEAVLKHEAVDRVINRLAALPKDAGPAAEQARAAACCWWGVEQGYEALARFLVQLLGQMVEPACLAEAHVHLPSAEQRVADAWQNLPAVQRLGQERQHLADQLQLLLNQIRGLKKPSATLARIAEELPEKIQSLAQGVQSYDQKVLEWLRQTLVTKEGQPKTMGFAPVKTVIDPLQAEWVPLVKDFAFDYPAETRALDAADRLVSLLPPAHHEYLRLCREVGAYDFLTVARQTRDLLAARPKVAAALKRRYRYVLVDEFQDTNQLQWDIISYLVGEGHDGLLDRDRLFIVGDPQQSIYRFRQADVSVFQRIHDLIQRANAQHGHADQPTDYDTYKISISGDSPSSSPAQRLGVMPLKENFRSLAPMPLLLLNRVFQHTFDPIKQGFDPRQTPFEVSYQDLEAACPIAACGEVRYVIPKPPTAEGPEDEEDNELDAGDIGRLQVQAVVDQLIALRGQPKYTAKEGEKATLDWCDMAVLLPSRDVVLTNLDKELTRRRVPFVVTKGVGFWQRQEVRDLVNLASWLADTGDELALFAVLRSPLGQLNDAEILFLSQFGLGRLGRGLGFLAWLDGSLQALDNLQPHQKEEVTAYWQRLPDDLRTALTTAWQEWPSPTRDNLRTIWPRLHTWHERADRLSHADLLQQALEESGAYAIYAAEPNGETALANLARLFALIRAEDERSAPGLARLARWLRDQVEDALKEEQAPLPTGQNAVQIMTVHAAKGLEFPVVAVMKMERRAIRYRGHYLELRVKNEHDNLLPEDAPLFPSVPPGTVAVSVRHPEQPRQYYRSRLLQALARLEQAQEKAESRRLFYVAATRAKERLILAGKQPPPTQSGLRKLPESWQKWFEEALGLTEEHKDQGYWEDPTGLRLTIITGTTEPGEVETPLSSLPGETLALQSIPERPPWTTIAVTALEPMRLQWRENRYQWWLRYRQRVLPEVACLAETFREGFSTIKEETIGKAIGTLVHRLLECPEIGLPFASTRRDLLTAMAANVLAIPPAGDELAEENTADELAVSRVVEGVERVLQKLTSPKAEGRQVRQMLEAPGEAEVEFILRLGHWQVVGRFDKLIRVGEGFEILDWKTDATGTPAAIAARHHEQMRLYALALYRSGRHILVEGAIRVHLVLLHFPRVERLHFTPLELEAAAAELEAELTEMDAWRE